MPVSRYFDNYQNTTEQGLLEDLIAESINIYGIDMYYLPRRLYDEDQVFGEDVQSFFDTALTCECYLKNVDGFEGEGSFLSKIGVEVRNEITLTLANRTFMNQIGYDQGFTRPREGDLIFFPFNNKCFEIVWVEKWSMMYPLGGLYVYDVRCEMFEYSGQEFTTGIPIIDSIVQTLSQDLFDWAILNESGNVLLMENGTGYATIEGYNPGAIDPLDQRALMTKQADAIIDFTEADPFSENNEV